jgi:BspA type Leucine rich repeat region (6 copies)
VNGVLFDKNHTTLILFPCGKSGSYTIPDGVTGIVAYAFAYCERLASVTIPGSVNNIEVGTFWACTNLASVYFTGNAPYMVDQDAFNGFETPNQIVPYDPATLYYLPGALGWSGFAVNNFILTPTALWLPQVQTDDGSFGVKNNQFGCNISWASGQTVVVEACTNLVNPVWKPVQTFTLTNGSTYFSDPQSANLPGRFYRLRSP